MGQPITLELRLRWALTRTPENCAMSQVSQDSLHIHASTLERQTIATKARTEQLKVNLIWQPFRKGMLSQPNSTSTPVEQVVY